jgi:hypothetical protein
MAQDDDESTREARRRTTTTTTSKNSDETKLSMDYFLPGIAPTFQPACAARSRELLTGGMLIAGQATRALLDTNGGVSLKSDQRFVSTFLLTTE